MFNKLLSTDDCAEASRGGIGPSSWHNANWKAELAKCLVQPMENYQKNQRCKNRPSCLQMIFHKMIQQLGMIYSQQSPLSQYNNASPDMRFTYQARNKAQKCWINVILSSKKGMKDAGPSPTLVLGVLLTCAS